MLQELSVVEQRYLAVREVLDGGKVTEVATRYGVDRRTVHRWLVRYATEGLAALSDRSSRPDRCPHQASAIAPRPIHSRRPARGGATSGFSVRCTICDLRARSTRKTDDGSRTHRSNRMHPRADSAVLRFPAVTGRIRVPGHPPTDVHLDIRLELIASTTRSPSGPVPYGRSAFLSPGGDNRHLTGHCLSWTVNPISLSTATAPLFPPSKSAEPRRVPVANSNAVPKTALCG